MQFLPPELQQLVIEKLSLGDMNSVSQCSRYYYSLVTPLLYKQLALRFRAGVPDRGTKSMLRVLSHRTCFHALIRHIRVISDGTRSWPDGHSDMLSIVLSPILAQTTNITTFSTSVSWEYTDHCFRDLKELESLRVQSSIEFSWVAWHLSKCKSLQRLRLGVSPYLPMITPHGLSPYLNLARVKDLSLQCVDLRMVKPSFGAFRNLELNLCPGTDQFLQQLEGHNELKSFRLAGHVSDSTLSTFLGKLSRSCRLEELALRIGNCSNNVNIALIRSHFQSIKLLVLDYRREITDPRSSKKFHFHQVQALLNKCPHLEFLGLPVEFRDAQGRRGRRKDIMTTGAGRGNMPSAATSSWVVWMSHNRKTNGSAWICTHDEELKSL
ncbi:hypothetical protein B0J13DRAFT_613451 [Dactylonectria estremocensis]|uniref:F-box domain-containing protein n=1 Tax=Dactylonectria estremocensis TaxID=1079267 RepID=A0A9P9DBG0_9HYPO|nr:hypothetical protein B0J13DRAFT_613451 [Dactylonectria estremocensis]